MWVQDKKSNTCKQAGELADEYVQSSKNALSRNIARIARKGPFLHSCKILWDLAGILQESCLRFLLNPIRSHKILQEYKKRTLSCNSCNISCKSVFTGKADRVAIIHLELVPTADLL